MPYWLVIRQGVRSGVPWYLQVQRFATSADAWAHAEAQSLLFHEAGIDPPEYAVFYGSDQVGRDGKAVAK